MMDTSTVTNYYYNYYYTCHSNTVSISYTSYAVNKQLDPTQL